MDIGTKLRQARMNRGFSLADISQATKMPSHVLERIETGLFDQLPGGLFTRGYLRAFAREVGLDPEEIVSQYRAHFEPRSPEDEPLKLHSSSYQESERHTTGFALVITIAFAFLIYVYLAPRPAEAPTDIPIDAVVAAVDVGTGPMRESTVVTTHADHLGARSTIAPAYAESLQIELRPQMECWVSATADGRPVIYRLMQGGERETIRAREEIVLRVGDAGALRYVVNGSDGRVLGAPGEPVTIRITTDNAGTWLTKQPGQPALRAPETIASPHHVGI